MKDKLMRVISRYNKEIFIEKISNNSISFNILCEPVRFGVSDEEIRNIKVMHDCKQSIDIIE